MIWPLRRKRSGAAQRVLVIGSPDWTEDYRVGRCLSMFVRQGSTVVLLGSRSLVDQSTLEFWPSRGKIERLEPHWGDGRGAASKARRDAFASGIDLVLSFSTGECVEVSRTMRMAMTKGIPVIEVSPVGRSALAFQ